MDILGRFNAPAPVAIEAFDEEPEVPTLTKKEKKALQKLERKERKLREQNEEKKLIMRDDLRRELELSKLNINRLNEKWREVIEQIKLEDLKVEIMEWQDKLQRNVRQKDSLIQLLLDDMQQTEELHQRIYASHTNTINSMCDIFNELVNTHKELHEHEVQDCLEQFMQEMNDYENSEREFMENMENIELNKCLMTELELWEDFKIYVQRMDERILTEIMRRNENRDKVITRMREMHTEVANYVYELKNASLDGKRYERLRALTQRQEAFQQQGVYLDAYELRVARIYYDLQRDILMHDADTQRKITNLNVEHAYFAGISERLDHERELNNKLTMERMKVLASESRRAVEYFRTLVNKGEKLLSLVASCRKFQTQNEKIDVLHDQAELADNEETPTFAGIDLQDDLDLSADVLSDHLKLMRFFYRRFAVVQNENSLLKNEKSKLEAENRALAEEFTRYSRTIDIDNIKGTITFKPTGL